MKARITTALFTFLIFALAAVNLAMPKRAFSENENRYLQQMPEFSLKNLFGGSFTSDFDTYITDQFAFRDSWVGVKSIAELALRKHASNGVYFASGGGLVEMFDEVDMDRYAKNLGYVRSFAERVREESGVTVRTILVPTSSLIYRDRLPAFAPEVDQKSMLELAANTIPGLVDISGALEKHSGEYVYYNTDHHWTSLGAYYSYNSFLSQTGRNEKPIEGYTLKLLSDRFYGTTWSKASLYSVKPDLITAFIPKDLSGIHVDYNDGEKTSDTIYEYGYLEVKDKYSVFLNANQSVTRIETENKNGRKLLLVKDSYANTFVQFLLTDYEEIHVIDPRYYRSSFAEFVAENDITEVLLLYNLKGFAADANIYFLTT